MLLRCRAARRAQAGDDEHAEDFDASSLLKPGDLKLHASIPQPATMDYKRRTQSKVSAEEANALSKSNQVSEKAKRVRTSWLDFRVFFSFTSGIVYVSFTLLSSFSPALLGLLLRGTSCSSSFDFVSFCTLSGAFVDLSLQSPVSSTLMTK